MLKDLGIALRDGDVTLNDDLVISVTVDSMRGRPVRYDGDTTEIVYEIWEHMGSFVLPLNKEQFRECMREDRMISFKIVRVMDEVVASSGEAFCPVECEAV